jgi:outer membrane protein assembly factor BamE
MPRLLFIFVLFPLLALGCARNDDGTWKAPLVYRIDIQQGNVVDQSMINKLKPGMDKKQVKFIMGSPLITDTFHSNRWDYLYSFEPGRGEREQRRITLFFNGDKLAYVEGDIQVTDKPRVEDETKKDRTVAVPLENDKPGFFKRLFSRNKKNTTEVKLEDSTQATEPTATAPANSDNTGAATTDAQTEPAAPGASGEQATTEPATTPESPPETKTTTSNKDTSKVQSTSTAGNTQEKNLLRRFWDRMTKSDIESDVDVESEQTRRDAEVLKGAGGEINQ